MPSQEEYLDGLLKDIMNGGQESEGTSGEIPADFFDELLAEAGSAAEENDVPFQEKDSYDVQDTMNMSPEDIERLLAQNENRTVQMQEPEREKKSLDALLEEAEQVNLKDIQDMLQKSDRNEPVNEDIVALLERAQDQNAEIDWKDFESSAEPEENTEKGQKPEKGLHKIQGKIANLFKGKKKDKADKKKKGKESERSEEHEAIQSETKKINSGEINSREINSREINPREVNSEEIDSEMTDLFSAIRDIGENAEEESSVTGMADESFTDAEQTNASSNIQEIPMDEIREATEEELLGLRDKNDAAAESTDAGTELENTADLFGDFDALSDMDAAEAEKVFAELTGESTEAPNAAEQPQEQEKKKPEKKGFFAKILDFLTEEDEAENPEQELILSDENDAIIKELDKEDQKKGKKGKKDSKGKGKGKGKEASEDDAEVPVKKEKKPKKPKKEKKPNEPEKPEKKLSKRRVVLIFLICLSVGAVLIILGNVTVDFADKKKAAKAFYEKDYEECYQNLVGKDLNESQQVMFGKSESILRIRLWMREYELLAQEGLEPEALDSLMQSVHDYPTLYDFSGKWNAHSEVQEIYGQMLEILQTKYGLSEEMAKVIANEPDDLLYSRMVRAVAAGGTFGSWEEEQAPEESLTEPVEEDVLPEEEEMTKPVFAE